MRGAAAILRHLEKGVGSLGAREEATRACPMGTAVSEELVYSNCLDGSFDASTDFISPRQLFDRMPDLEVVRWTSTISTHAKKGCHDLALACFSRMRMLCVEPNETTLSTVVGICSQSNRIEMGMSLHCLIVKKGFQNQLFVASNLISMYSKCGRIKLARRVFDEMPVHDAVSWNSMVAAYSHKGLSKEAIGLFSLVLSRGGDNKLLVNNFTLSSVLKACASWGCARVGRSVHCFVIKLGFNWDVVIMGSLIDMYAKCGSLDGAHRIFDRMGEQDVVAWNALISGYAQNSHGEEAIELFRQMHSEGFLPNQITFASILKASAGLEEIDLGRWLHAKATKCGYLSDLFVGTALVDMYSKCLQMEAAESAFMEMARRNLVSFNALITGYGLIARYEKALQAYVELRNIDMEPDPFTFTGLLSSCYLGALAEGTQIHCHSIKFGLDSNVSVGNSLVSFYAKCGLTDGASKAFESLITPNAISWAGIISSFAQNDQGEKSLEYFHKMHMLSGQPDEFSMSIVLKALAGWAAAEQGKHLHALAIKIGLESVVLVGTALVDMYGNCGMVEDSFRVFTCMPEKNAVSWNAMIITCAQNGFGRESLNLFWEMVDVGVSPGSVTFVGILVACSHAGLVEEGRFYYNLMVSDYEISPAVEHCTCMVDLLGRTGHLDEAETFLKNSPFSLEPVIWRSLLAFCGIHKKNIDIAIRASEQCLQLEPHCSATYVLLSNIYASNGLWSEVVKIRNLMEEMGIRKEPGFSWIEVKNMVHVFTAEGNRSGDMLATLQSLMVH